MEAGLALTAGATTVVAGVAAAVDEGLFGTTRADVVE
eukprot:CAMPEP_0176134930 /NCGR_PEP_ID=MMETSP0120_2-20121206/68430_1 /TAXON_ID=160619 /ORGANISM="Kryptoperidinium foliaceum, Strain CCMP 1326" /LENGTH=36 /DNA_ID= /DNA_START= /DNA_END= /DNA_ORIENTATION=